MSLENVIGNLLTCTIPITGGSQVGPASERFGGEAPLVLLVCRPVAVSPHRPLTPWVCLCPFCFQACVCSLILWHLCVCPPSSWAPLSALPFGVAFSLPPYLIGRVSLTVSLCLSCAAGLYGGRSGMDH